MRKVHFVEKWSVLFLFYIWTVEMRQENVRLSLRGVVSYARDKWKSKWWLGDVRLSLEGVVSWVRDKWKSKWWLGDVRLSLNRIVICVRDKLESERWLEDMCLSLEGVVSCTKDKLGSEFIAADVELSLEVEKLCIKDKLEQRNCGNVWELSSGCAPEASGGQKRGKRAAVVRKSVLHSTASNTAGTIPPFAKRKSPLDNHPFPYKTKCQLEKRQNCVNCLK